MEVNVAFSPPAKAQELEQEPEESAEYVDPDWQRAKQKLFSPKGSMRGIGGLAEQESGLLKIEELKTELIKTLKHAANIRNMKPDEWVILTVIGKGRQSGEFYEEYYRSAAPRSRTSTYGRSSSGGGGGYGYSAPGGSVSYSRGKSSGGGGGGMVGGMPMGMGGYGGGYGMEYDEMGGMEYGDGSMEYGEDYGEMPSPSVTVLTIRTKKSDVDAFAKGELDFEQFQQKVQIFTY
jgi:hypothetical protein